MTGLITPLFSADGSALPGTALVGALGSSTATSALLVDEVPVTATVPAQTPASSDPDLWAIASDIETISAALASGDAATTPLSAGGGGSSEVDPHPGHEMQDFVFNTASHATITGFVADLTDGLIKSAKLAQAAMELPGKIEERSGIIQKILDGLEKAAELAQKIPPIANVSKVLVQVFDKIGDFVKAIEKLAGKVAKTADKIADNLDNGLKHAETMQKILDNVSKAFEATSLASEAAYLAADDLHDIDGNHDLLECMDDLVEPANDLLVIADLVPPELRIELTTDLLELGGQVSDLKALNGKLGDILDVIEPLEDPLDDLKALLDRPAIQKALDASQRAYDVTVKPVVDPLIEALGLNSLIDKAADKLNDLLPDTGPLNSFDQAIAPLADFPDFTNFDDFAAFVEITDFLDTYNVDRTEVSGLPLDLSTEAVKNTFWRNGSNGDDTIDDTSYLGGEAYMGGIVFGLKGDDILKAVHNDKSDILFGGLGDDTLRSKGTAADSDAFDIFFGDQGDDRLLADGNVVVSYRGSIGDYVISVKTPLERAGDGSVTQLGEVEIEHLRLPGAEVNEGKDTITYDHRTRISFEGFGVINLQTFLENLQVATGGNNLNGSDGVRDFLIGAEGNNTLRGRGDDDYLAGQDRADKLIGGAGDDYLDGGNGRDVYKGGPGNDTATFLSVTKASDFDAPDGVTPFGNDSTRGAQVFLGKTEAEQLDLGFYATDQVFDVENIIGSTRRDLFFGEADKDNIIFGQAGADILRATGRGTDGNYLDGGAFHDVLVLDAGGDTGKGDGGNDIFLVAMKNAAGALLLGNQIDGGTGQDVVSYLPEERSQSFSQNTLYGEVFFDDPDQFGADLDLTVLMSGGFVQVLAEDGVVNRFLTGQDSAPATDVLTDVEYVIGTDNADFVQAAQGSQFTRISAADGEDVFTTAAFDRAVTSDDGTLGLTTQILTLAGGAGDDLFELRDLYSVLGGSGQDVLDLSKGEGLSWYLDMTGADRGLAAFEDPDSLPDALGSERFDAKVTGIETVIGGEWADVLVGGEDTKRIEGGAGNDVLFARPGGAVHRVVVLGGEGDDHLVGGAKRDRLDGGDGNDILDLTKGVSSGKEDMAFGGSGDDVFYVTSASGAMSIDGGETTYTFEDDDGNILTAEHVDLVDFTKGTSGNQGRVFVDLQNNANNAHGAEGYTFTGIENLAGSSGNDTLRGDGEDNTLFGRLGDDVIKGRGGHDVLISGGGSDVSIGDGGQDTIWGGTAGFNNVGQADEVFGGSGSDTLTFAFLRPVAQGGSRVLGSGIGTVEVDLTNARGGATGSATFTADGDGSKTLTLINGIENIVGGDLADELKGNGEANRINGGGGADNIVGRSGNDELEGGLGNDTVSGGGGDDVVLGSSGADSLSGGSGTDILDYAQSTEGVAIDVAGGTVAATFLDTIYRWADTEGSEARGNLPVRPWDVDAIADPRGAYRAIHVKEDRINQVLNNAGEIKSAFAIVELSVTRSYTHSISGFERFVGSQGDDTYLASANADDFDGAAGVDTVSFAASTAGVNLDLSFALPVASGGFAAGDSYRNVENIVGSDHADTLIGDSGANALFGGLGDDALSGGNGDDHLNGGFGADNLAGGGGTDTADYSDSTSAVTVHLNSGVTSGGDAAGDTISGIENMTGIRKS